MGVHVTYIRAGGRGVPPEAETIAVAGDGTFDAWRTVANGAVGRFAGSLDEEVAARIAAAAAAADGSAAPAATRPPGAPRESIQVGDAAATDVSRQSTGPWGDLRTALIDALEAAVAFPSSAIALTVTPDAGAPTARLAPAGRGSPLAVEIEGATFLVVRYTDGWEETGRVEVPVPALDADVALGPGVAPSTGDRLQVTVTFTADDHGRMRKVQVTREGRGA